MTAPGYRINLAAAGFARKRISKPPKLDWSFLHAGDLVFIRLGDLRGQDRNSVLRSERDPQPLWQKTSHRKRSSCSALAQEF
ncbi:hypothetical protein IVB18_40100 [Bradyrhizobium sp. 186]|uniref:hypothetical protein n=1 Tax=Bradyrhizobium sp. 186 TaxID=2782654 RepID=UPI00200194AA|nr:hypothetical protein [Bradyrhizobium sp. 186]UPK34273.1 hypothetical protein IVB18_40100 [Bradyrhizobium sp. 186]